MRIDALNTNMTAPVYDPARAANAVKKILPPSSRRKRKKKERRPRKRQQP